MFCSDEQDLIDDMVRCEVTVSLFAVNVCNLKVFLVAVKNVVKVNVL